MGERPMVFRKDRPISEGCTTRVYTFFFRRRLPWRTMALGMKPKSFFRYTSTRRATALLPVENSRPQRPRDPVTNEPLMRRRARSSAVRQALSSRWMRASSFFTCSVNDINDSSSNNLPMLPAQYWRTAGCECGRFHWKALPCPARRPVPVPEGLLQ